MAQPPPAPSPPRPSIKPSFLGIIGGILVVLGTFLPWFGDSPAISSKIPFSLLWGNPSGEANSFSIGVVILPLAVLGVVLSFLAGGNGWRRVVGLLIALIGVVFAIQAFAAFDDVGEVLSSIIGVYPTVIGGVLLLLGDRSSRGPATAAA